MKRVLFLSLLVFMSISASAHKYFVSIAEMEYDEEGQKINVSLQSTAHDFEAVIEKKLNKRIHLENVKDSTEEMAFVRTYLAKNFKVYSNSVALEMKYLGMEVTVRDNLYFYLSFLNPTKPQEIEVESTYLTQEYESQQNIVHYKYKDATKSVTLVASKNKEKIKFDK